MLCDSTQYLPADHPVVPCITVPECSSGSTYFSFDQWSTGLSDATCSVNAELCYTDFGIELGMNALNDTIIRNDYLNCNDPVYYQSVMEYFIAPFVETDPHCYSELDISPNNVMVELSIYNQNLDTSHIETSFLTCSKSGLKHTASINQANNEWSAHMSVPWTIVNCPPGCPNQDYCTSSPYTVGSQFRFNLYRIRELVSTSSCSSSKCEYLAWSPTMVSPPSFHRPIYFGIMILD